MHSRIDLEVTPQHFPGIRAAEAVRPQNDVLAGNPLANLVGHEPDVVAGGDEGPLHSVKRLLQERLLRFRVRVQAVPAAGRHGVAAEFAVAGHAPDVAADAVGLLQHLLSLEDLRQDRTAAEQLRADLLAFAGRGRAEPVHPLENALGDALLLGHGGHLVLLVVDREVVEDALVVDVHPPQTILDDDGQFEGERGIVGDEIRDGRRHQLTVTVFVLQTFAVERRPAGRSPRRGSPSPGNRPHTR